MKKLDRLINIYLILNVIYSFLVGFMYWIFKIPQSTLSDKFIIVAIINIIIFIIVCRIKKYKLGIVDLLLVLITIFGIIATIFAYNQNISIFGAPKRHEGLLTIIYYLSLIEISSLVKSKNKKMIVYSIIVVCFLNVFYALLQSTELTGIRINYHNHIPWASGFVHNPNFLGILALIGLSYLIGLFIKENKEINNLIYGSLILLFMYVLLIANTLSVLVGLIAVMLVVFIYAIKDKAYKQLLIICIILLSTTIFTHITKQTTLINDLVQTKKETINLVDGTAQKTQIYGGTGRVYIWKETIKVVPKHLLHGVGIDNYKYILDGKPILRNNIAYDKAHNELLQILVTQGIFSFLSYICLYFIIIKNGIKNAFIDKELYLILPVIGYIVQAMFNISVVTVAPLFYIAIGLTINRKTLE